MINNYQDFILENLILESTLEFSDKFKNILEIIPSDNEIRNTLIDMKGKGDYALNQNFIDVTTNKEEVSFIPDRRAQDLMKSDSKTWRTNGHLPGAKFLRFTKDSNGDYNNQGIFSMLGFSPIEPISENHPVPGPGVTGEIVSEAIGPKSGRTYVLFKWNQGGEDRLIAINKEALDETSELETKLYSQNRNPIRIGRLVNSIMSAAKKPVTPKQVEDFSKEYKAAWDIVNDAFLKFDVVSGYAIAKWYNESTYETDLSTLGGSCMQYDECGEYFGIYTDNSDVCKLVILYSDKGASIKDGKFRSNYIKGRALLWKTNQGDMFMDRVYTNYDSDVELFKQFAEKNGWWCKNIQNSNSDFTAYKGGQLKNSPTYTVDLKWADYEYYPYVDTLCYLSLNELDSGDQSGIISNNPDVINVQYQLRDTEGARDPY